MNSEECTRILLEFFRQGEVIGMQRVLCCLTEVLGWISAYQQVDMEDTRGIGILNEWAFECTSAVSLMAVPSKNWAFSNSRNLNFATAQASREELRRWAQESAKCQESISSLCRIMTSVEWRMEHLVQQETFFSHSGSLFAKNAWSEAYRWVADMQRKVEKCIRTSPQRGEAQVQAKSRLVEAMEREKALKVRCRPRM